MGCSLFENCRLAAQARVQKPGAWWRDAERCEVSTAAARAAATRAGLDDLLERPAGMGAEETKRMLTLLAELKTSHAILLVEHDMDAVFRIADRITVMVNGAVIASGTADFVRNSAEVRVLSIGRALMTHPALIVLDEATEGLAPLIVAEIWRVIGEIRASGIATLIVDRDNRQGAGVLGPRAGAAKRPIAGLG